MSFLMKNRLLPWPLFLVMLLGACGILPEEVETLCLPLSMSATVIAGSNTTKIIADFSYLEDSDLLDHITWSNYQTHYFEYDEQEQLAVVRKLKVKEKIQEEMWFRRDGSLVSEVRLVVRNLDYIYLEPLDSIYIGHIAFEYEGSLVTRETCYDAPREGGEEVMVSRTDYTYDAGGNILSSTTTGFGEGAGTVSAQMSYDQGKHPLSGLKYYFTGESRVNCLASRSSGIDTGEYTYDNRLNANGYPETIYENLGSSITSIIRYTYRCSD
jgi:hypothetical protein